MKKALLVLAVIIIATAAFAADAAKCTAKGDKALLFSATLFNAGNYGGAYAIGAKYYLANGLALRPVLRFGYGSTTIKTEPDSIVRIGATEHITFKDSTDHITNFGIELGAEKTLLTKAGVNVYVGGVAGFGISSEKVAGGSSSTYTLPGGGAINQTSSIDIKTQQSSTSFKFGAIIGGEFFVTESISLGGEYQFGLSMSSQGKNETDRTDVNTNGNTTTTTSVPFKNPKQSTTDIGFSTVGLVLGIRF